MFKPVTVSFRTKRELLELLDRASHESQCSRSSLIETILSKALADCEEKGVKLEDRIQINGAVPVAEGYESDGITYVALGKVRIGLPKNLRCQINFDEKRSIFQLELISDDKSVPNALSDLEVSSFLT